MKFLKSTLFAIPLLLVIGCGDKSSDTGSSDAQSSTNSSSSAFVYTEEDFVRDLDVRLEEDGKYYIYGYTSVRASAQYYVVDLNGEEYLMQPQFYSCGMDGVRAEDLEKNLTTLRKGCETIEAEDLLDGENTIVLKILDPNGFLTGKTLVAADTAVFLKNQTPISSPALLSSSSEVSPSSSEGLSSSVVTSNAYGNIYKVSIGLDSTKKGNLINFNDATVHLMSELIADRDFVFHALLFYDSDESQVRFGTRSSAYQSYYRGQLFYTQYNDDYFFYKLRDTLSFDQLEENWIDVSTAEDMVIEEGANPLPPFTPITGNGIYLVMLPMITTELEYRIVRFRNVSIQALFTTADLDIYIPSAAAITKFNEGFAPAF